jgi:hypothetical protein
VVFEKLTDKVGVVFEKLRHVSWLTGGRATHSTHKL